MGDPSRHVVEVLGYLPYASNATLMGRDEDGAQVVYKPDRGEQPLWDFRPGSLASREVLTYEVSEAMELHLVPETWAVDGPFGPGSAQRWVEEDFDADPRRLLAGPDSRLWSFAVLDLVSNNADRKLGHVLIEAGTGRLWGIDHGLTFHELPKLRTVLWGFAGERVPEELLGGVDRLVNALDSGLEERVATLLSGREALALRRRACQLLDDPVHPQPPTDRPPIPWPAW